MTLGESPVALRSLLGELVVNRKDIDALEKACKNILEEYRALVETLKRLKLLELVEVYEKLKGCSEHYSWVLNKAGKRYYYYYLKCKDQKPATIYIGKSPEGYNSIKHAARRAVELKLVLDRLRRDLNELEVALGAFRESLITLGVVKNTS
jgi:hypothetical protein